MVIEYQRTVWFPKDLLFAIVVHLVIWLVACGIVWVCIMNLVLEGGGLLWVVPGMMWGGIFWFFFSMFVAVACREVVVTVPLNDPAKIADRLSEAAKPLRYTVEENPPSVFLCRPKRWLARRFQCNAVQVQMHEGTIELTGPAIIVKRFAKGLRS